MADPWNTPMSISDASGVVFTKKGVFLNGVKISNTEAQNVAKNIIPSDSQNHLKMNLKHINAAARLRAKLDAKRALALTQ
jgi:hypothetical protein